jgi:hypothetical protein
MESVLLDVAGHRRRPRRCRATTGAVRHATRASSIRLTRRRWRRSSRSCAQSVAAPTASDSARSLSCCGALAYG